jgi:DNA-directed RNA polymerase specialized sigma24 family protein
MRHREGLESEQIGERLGLSGSRVRGLLSEANRKLLRRLAFGPEGGAAGDPQG